MAIYKVTFTPSGPYFFGNEKSFVFHGATAGGEFGNPYFIRGENMPSQSTLLGAIRYILLPVKGFDKLCEKQNTDTIGKESFVIDSSNVQSFGKIKGLSAIFLSNGDECFIPTPFDHNMSKPETVQSDEITRVFYTPFQDYLQYEKSDKLYTTEYDAKKGLADCFMSLRDFHIEEGLFASDLRVGINRAAEKDGFFKKEYKYLAKGYAFAVFAEIDLELDDTPQIVMLGQGKVPFSVQFIKIGEEDTGALARLAQTQLERKNKSGKKIIYCLSDMLVEDGELYETMRFAIVQTRDYRSYSTQNGGKIIKGGYLHRLVKAGSIFIPGEATDCNFGQTTIQQKNAAAIGYNQAVITGGTSK